MNEIWKDIPGYEGLYQVSNLGRVKSLERIVKVRNQPDRHIKERYKTPVISNQGYYIVQLYKSNKYDGKTIHRLVAEVFIPNPDKKPAINHIDGNKLNNNVDNLEWVTYKENSQHAFATGLNSAESIAKGQRSPCHIYKSNSSGRKGVYFDKRTQRWMSYITINGKMVYLGRYENIEEAVKARESKEREL